MTDTPEPAQSGNAWSEETRLVHGGTLRSGFAETSAERSDLLLGLPGRSRVEKPDLRHRRLLRMRHKRPGRRRAPEQTDKFPSAHVIKPGNRRQISSRCRILPLIRATCVAVGALS